MDQRAIGIGVLMLGLLALPAMGAETCVVCSEPAATYRCAIEGADRYAQYRGSDRVIQYVCITELVKSGGHARCSVGRNAGGACVGELKVLRAGDALAAAAEAAVRDASERFDRPQTVQPSSPPSDQPPRTLEELARKTVEQSGGQLQSAGKTMNDTAKTAGRQIEKAGDAVGGAVKKTWTCLASLFTDC
jgi:hypothetical protein